MLGEVEKLAKEEMRSVDSQAIYILKGDLNSNSGIQEPLIKGYEWSPNRYEDRFFDSMNSFLEVCPNQENPHITENRSRKRSSIRLDAISE